MSDELIKEAIIMANARSLIKKKAITSNGRLYSDLFGTGIGTGQIRARELGLDPYSNVTSFSEMRRFIENKDDDL